MPPMVRVLGPLAVDGVVLGSARQRRLLAALALCPGEPVPTAVLAERVWGADQPADPAGAIQTNVARLRRLLPAGITVETTPEGYRLHAEVDALVFAGHVAAGRHAEALELWRGIPFTELDDPGPPAVRLAELRRQAAEEHGRTLLAAGRAAEAVAGLDALVAEEPVRENAVGLLMRALVAAGRQAEALAVYEKLRGRLAAELGVDPAAELRDLHERLLRQEPVRPAVPAGSFVGRAAELAQAAELLERCRLVTLTGPGGVGKTRLARQLAAAHPADVLVVELAEGGPRDVEPTLAGALRITDDGPLHARIVEVLAPKRLLLVLDNCEHVIDEAAALAEAVVAGAPDVVVLATSREALRIDGEQVLPLAPLREPEAARLLADRIRAGDPGAEIVPELAAEVCRRLDGLPLALELAAARAVPLGLPGLVEALDRPLEVLRGGRRTAAGRHRSLHDVVAWSHGLLDADQAALFDRMAVFAGPVEPAAIAAVCGTADALPDLVDRSLVVRRGTRFGMLETLRAFGRARLARTAWARELRARHAAWACALAEELRAARRGPGEAAAIARFDDHLPDLRRAHAWLLAEGPAGDLLPLTTLFAELGYLRCRIDLVALAEQRPAGAEAVYFVAAACWQRGDLERSAALAGGLVAAGGAEAAYGHEVLANVYGFQGRTAASLAAARAALPGAEALGDHEMWLGALVDALLAVTYDRAGADAADVSAAEEAWLEAEIGRVAALAGNPTALALAAYARGEVRAERADPAAAAHLREAVALAEQVDSAFVAGIARHTLVTAAAREGTAPLAELRPLLEHWHRAGSWTQLWVAVRALVEVLARLGRDTEAATLLGALRASARATPAFGADLARERTVEAALHDRLGPGLAAALAAGAALGDAAALDLALRATAPG